MYYTRINYELKAGYCDTITECYVDFDGEFIKFRHTGKHYGKITSFKISNVHRLSGSWKQWNDEMVFNGKVTDAFIRNWETNKNGYL